MNSSEKSVDHSSTNYLRDTNNFAAKNVKTNHDRNSKKSMTSSSRYFYWLAVMLLVGFLFFSFVPSVGGQQQPPGDDSRKFIKLQDTKQTRDVIIEVVRNISESEPVGHVVQHFQAYDKDPGDLFGTNYTFIITHESDIKRMFSIGDKDGILKVAKPLDREDQSTYRLIVKVIDQNGKEGHNAIRVNLIDVNDNAPYLNLNQRYVVWEEQPPQFIGTVTAWDPDLPENGPPFNMQQAANSTVANLISVVFNQLADGGNGAINVSSKIQFDREVNGKFLYVPIYVKDTKGLGAIRYLPIEIGDINDSPMTDGSSTIFVYNFQGQMPDTVIGRVYVTDLDDWDVVDKTFTFSSSYPKPTYFTLLPYGLVVMSAGTPEGSYTLYVNVVDTKKNENAVGTVTVVVEYIYQKAIDNSGSVRIRGISGETFIRPANNTNSPYQRFRTALANYLSVSEKSIKIFSVLDVPGESYPPMIDVYFAVINASTLTETFLSPVLITGIVEQKRLELEAVIGMSGVQIVQVNIDPCILEECTLGGCVRVVSVNSTPSVIMANMTSLVGVNLNVTSDCRCPRMNLNRSCDSNSCYNNGICHNTQTGIFCECRGPYNNGSRCEGRTRNFHSGGYAWLKPIGSCENFSISLEFMTKSANATLLYNGPMQNGRDNDIFIPDFIGIFLINGLLVVQVNLGGGMTAFAFNKSLSPTVNDGNWHSVDVIASQREFEIILDRCSNITTQGSPANPRSLESCRYRGTAQGSNEQLNVDDPLQLGGMASVDGAPFNQTLTNAGVVGCLRNLVVNGELYDLDGVVKAENSDFGCGLTDQYCQPNNIPICVHGECVANLFGVVKCVCEIGWYGQYCDKEAPWKTFNAKSYVQYAFAENQPQTYNKIQVLFVPQKMNGYLTYAGLYPPTQSFLGVQLNGASVEFDYNFGSGQFSVKPISPLSTTGGNSYFVEVDRYWTYAKVTVDGLPYPYSAFRVGDNTEVGWMNYTAQKYFLGAASSSPSQDDFQGCIREFVFNDMYVPVADSNDFASVISQNGVSDGCAVFATCAGGGITCPAGLQCVDFWKGPFCTCPSNLPAIINPADGTLTGCGTSVAALHLGITRGAIAAILISLLALIILVLLLVVCSRRRRGAPPPEDNLISNVRDYKEEGGGEQDQERYNIEPLRIPVIPTDHTHHVGGAGISGKPKSKPKPDGDLDDFLRGRVLEAEIDPAGPPFDELRVYAVEQDGISVCSLSSLESAGSDIDWDDLDEWGPRFKKLANMYGGGTADDD